MKEENKMISLKEIQDRSNAGAKVLIKLFNAKYSPITDDELKILAECLKDLQHLNELMDYMGEEAIKQQDAIRLSRN